MSDFVSGMTPDEIRTVEALYGCRFTPGSPQKRFVRQLAARDRRRALTDRQREYLWRLAWSWRRQLPHEMAAVAYLNSGGRGLGNRTGKMEPAVD